MSAERSYMQTSKPREPSRIKNLAELKRLIKLGTEIKAVSHTVHPDIVGLTRVVTDVQTNGYYSKIKDDPEHKHSTCNYGKGFYSPFEKASFYEFDGTTIRVFNSRIKDRTLLYEMEVYDHTNDMTENNEAKPIEDNDPVIGM